MAHLQNIKKVKIPEYTQTVCITVTTVYYKKDYALAVRI